MKKLVSPGQVVTPSNFPRTRGGPDSRGIRICFSELGRSCALKQGYLLFTDGSAYAYDSVSNDVTEALCDQLRRGFTFNRQFRRAGFAFVRGFVPPPDYETIYTFPPYPGVRPTACPIPGPDFANLDWTVVNNSPGPGQTQVWVLDPGTGDTQECDATAGVGVSFVSGESDASLTYNGSTANCSVTLDTVGDPTFTLQGVFGTVFQDGVDVCDFSIVNDPNAHAVFPFIIADTLGSDSLITVQMAISFTTNTIAGSMAWKCKLSSP